MVAPIHGMVAPGFEVVQDEFVRNFTERGELGAACAIYYQGQKVVDLWGGYRDEQTQAPWEEDTLVIVFSSTKGVAGLMAHQAGLCVIDEPLNSDILADPDALAAILARQKPAWQPGTRHGYHAFSLGWYESEIIRRTDAQQRTLGQFFQSELAKPLGLEFYIGVPEGMPEERIATVTEPGPLQKLVGMPRGMMLSALRPGSLTLRVANPRVRSNLVFNRLPYRAVEMPSVNGIGQARSIAKAYSVFATGGKELNITARTLAALQAPAVPPSVGGWRDVILHMDIAYALGFLKPFSGYHFGSSDAAFGAPGSGGSFGFADPDAQVGYAYVMNKQGTGILDDPREKVVRDAFYQCLKERGASSPHDLGIIK